MLEKKLFQSIIKHTPLISIDLIVRNAQGQILLGKRNNRPAKNYWFVPGGRILKDESMADAFKRLLEVELGITDKNIEDSQLIDVYEHFYDDNVFQTDNEHQFSTHYVVIGRSIKYDIDLSSDLNCLPQDQHHEYKWFDEQQLLTAKDVHKHSKWYFENAENRTKT